MSSLITVALFAKFFKSCQSHKAAEHLLRLGSFVATLILSLWSQAAANPLAGFDNINELKLSSPHKIITSQESIQEKISTIDNKVSLSQTIVDIPGNSQIPLRIELESWSARPFLFLRFYALENNGQGDGSCGTLFSSAISVRVPGHETMSFYAYDYVDGSLVTSIKPGLAVRG